MSRDEQGPASAPRPRAATVLESIEEIRAQIARAPLGAGPVPAAEHAPRGAEEPDDTRPFRPAARPSMALLTVLDDGEGSGEVIRVRGASFVIGRVEGDLVIPHDTGISGRHAAILRTEDGRWTLKDLQSTNGTFARASSSVLRHRQEFLIGGRRLRFDASTTRGSASADEEAGPTSTRKWQTLAPADPAAGAAAVLVELTPDGEGRRHLLASRETWIGRDPRRCEVVLDDPMASLRHARVVRNDRGQWLVSNARSRNGLWMRVAELALDRGGYFQCGEQRFMIRVL